jgi:hypothetical protein
MPVKCIGLVCLVLASLASTSLANTTVYYSPAGGEWDLCSGLAGTSQWGAGDTSHKVLEHYYKSFARVDDSVDQIWSELDNGGVYVVAKFAGYWNALGYSTDPVTGLPVVTLAADQGGNVDAVFKTASLGLATGTVFVWDIQNTVQGYTYYSLPSLNPGGTDRMVTFHVGEIWNDPDHHELGSYVPADPTYVVCFEDLTDFDYQDLVVEVHGVAPIPEPLTIVSAFLGVSGLGAYVRRRLRGARAA